MLFESDKTGFRLTHVESYSTQYNIESILDQ